LPLGAYTSQISSLSAGNSGPITLTIWRVRFPPPRTSSPQSAGVIRPRLKGFGRRNQRFHRSPLPKFHTTCGWANRPRAGNPQKYSSRMPISLGPSPHTRLTFPSRTTNAASSSLVFLPILSFHQAAHRKIDRGPLCLFARHGNQDACLIPRDPRRAKQNLPRVRIGRHVTSRGTPHADEMGWFAPTTPKPPPLEIQCQSQLYFPGVTWPA
jgi:hypothetical protein